MGEVVSIDRSERPATKLENDLWVIAKLVAPAFGILGKDAVDEIRLGRFNQDTQTARMVAVRMAHEFFPEKDFAIARFFHLAYGWEFDKVVFDGGRWINRGYEQRYIFNTLKASISTCIGERAVDLPCDVEAAE